ncbi:MAG: hypothetical protein IJ193_00835 [Bacilli bacterium]|nr:hypothetical protein [Bacilli bacterium]
MQRISVGTIINGYKVLKLIFTSKIPRKSIYKVQCLECGTTCKMSLQDIEDTKCECTKDTIKVKPKRKIYFKQSPYKNIGIIRGKYTVVGFFFKKSKKEKPSLTYYTRDYIVKCNLCGELCIMNSNNLNLYKEKRDKNVRCNHKRIFHANDYKQGEYYINYKLVD